MKLKHSIYKIMGAPLIIASLTILIAFYSVGVVEKSNANEAADGHINDIINQIDENKNEYDRIINQLSSEYESKARTVSVIIAQTPKTITEDMTVEELRIAIGADMISLSDTDGTIVFSTSPDNNSKKINEHFNDGLDIRNYSEVYVTSDDNDAYVFEVAVSRRDAAGLAVFTFTNSAFSGALNYSELANAASINKYYPSGSSAILDVNSYRYLSHTNHLLTDTRCPVPSKKFSGDKLSFSYKIYGKSSLIYYKIHDNQIVMDIIPKNEVFAKRNFLLIWTLVSSSLILISVLLSIRKFKIDDDNDNTKQK